MMGVPCVGPAYVSGDSKSALANTAVPDSTLKKNHRAFAAIWQGKVLLVMNGEQRMQMLMKMRLIC